MKTILVCYEERPVAPRVLERSAELALALGAKLLVTSVAPILHSGKGIGPIDPVDPPERHDAELKDAVARLQELGATNVEAHTSVGDPATAIVNLAGERGIDLIVLGAHEGGLFSRILEGSTGDAVVHRAHTDVLVVH